MIPEFTVSEITRVLQLFIHENFGRIKVKGEISNLSQPKSGHTYLVLKDKYSIINSICWKETHLDIKPQNGLEVVCYGYLTTYQSKYQLIIEKMSLVGQGDLQKIFEERKKRLAEEGLFDIENKKTLPILPKILGIITSPTGAVINDIINRVQNRLPTNLLIWPVSVQGENSLQEIIRAIEEFNKKSLSTRPDVIIIARGGGSVEDLWIFNEEPMIRAIAKSKIPIISAIGHENDFTLVDYVADVRAPTPTASIEIALPTKKQLLDDLSNKLYRLNNILKYKVSIKHTELEILSKKLINPKYKLSLLKLQLNEYHNRMNSLIQTLILRKKQVLDNLYSKLNYYNKNRLLSLGYTLIRNQKNRNITTHIDLQPNDIITIEWHDGKRQAIIIEN